MTADAGEDMEKKEHFSIAGRSTRLVQPVWLFLRNLDIALPKDPAISLLGIYPRDAPTYNKDTCSTMFIATLLIIAGNGRKPRHPSTDERIEKMHATQPLETMTL